jgi:RNA recognition motif-containing protein
LLSRIKQSRKYFLAYFLKCPKNTLTGHDRKSAANRSEIFCLSLQEQMIKVFIVGFPREMEAGQLKELFDEFGDVHQVTLITDQESGQSKGYAFVDFLDETGARLAIKELDGTLLNGRILNVRLADRQPRARIIVERPVSERAYHKVRQPRETKRPRRRNF